MTSIARHGARIRTTTPRSVSAYRNSSAITFQCGLGISSRPWAYLDCAQSPIVYKIVAKERLVWSRTFATSLRCLEERKHIGASPERPEDSAQYSTSASLPSTTDRRRWQISRRMSHMMDQVLAKASIAGHHINAYTGTDYSGIEALKEEINVQEQKVMACHKAIDVARSAHHEAHAKQASSQKEIVSLLERKSSWSPEDLERYMSLVRSEHTDEQSVQAAKDGLAETDRDLENARSELERLERKQYHEEQIWSDTIRRNSTWVTFGLMGLNIILLLAQIAIFEPYRRRKIVKEVNRVLEEKSIVATATDVEKQVDEVTEQKGVLLETVEAKAMPEQEIDALIPPAESTKVQSGKSNQATGNVLPGEILEASNITFSPPPGAKKPEKWFETWEANKERLQDLFSERIIQVKKVDITTTALQGAATGVAAMGLLFFLWRPK